MKKILTICLLFIVVSHGVCQRKIKIVEFTEKGFSMELSGIKETKTTSFDRLEFSITPVSAKELNLYFYKSLNYSGLFQYEHYDLDKESYFLSRKRRMKNYKNISEYESFLERVESLLDMELISQQEYDDLNSQIYDYYDKEEEKSTFFLDTYLFNPYFINSTFLNLYEIEIENKNPTPKNFNNRLIIESGGLYNSPMTDEYLVELHKASNTSNIEKQMLIERFNLKDKVIIPPRTKLKFYFSTLPLNYENGQVTVAFEGSEKKLVWNVKKNFTPINETYKFYELEVEYYLGANISTSALGFHTFDCAEDNMFLIRDNILIYENTIQQEVKMKSIILSSGKFYFGQNTIKGTDYLDLEKMKRKTFFIKTQR